MELDPSLGIPPCIVHAALKPGFDFQRANLILVGMMVLAAALGFVRSRTGSRRRVVPASVAAFGVSMIGSGIFAPDPMAGFPAGAEQTASISGILHLGFGALGFLSLGVAAILLAGWSRSRSESRFAGWSRAAGIVVIVGFVGGGALGTTIVGIVSLWIAVLTGFAWLLAASRALYRAVPHPVVSRH